MVFSTRTILLEGHWTYKSWSVLDVNVSLKKSEHPHNLQLSFHKFAVSEAVYLVRQSLEKAPFHT